MESKNFDINYTGSLQTQMIHLKSGTIVHTDAPVDNNGKGSCFSPTDLVASALCSCMLTIIGIHFSKNGRELSEISCEVKKVMASGPRRIAEVHIDFDFKENNFSEQELQTVERIAMSCPVANSLSADLKVITNLG
ncbi:MAG: OsmC family protein [Flavobacteriales bacterium]|nr:OsmC family protein [Flavobacteriales bacterium]